LRKVNALGTSQLICLQNNIFVSQYFVGTNDGKLHKNSCLLRNIKRELFMRFLSSWETETIYNFCLNWNFQSPQFYFTKPITYVTSIIWNFIQLLVRHQIQLKFQKLFVRLCFNSWLIWSQSVFLAEYWRF